MFIGQIGSLLFCSILAIKDKFYQRVLRLRLQGSFCIMNKNQEGGAGVGSIYLNGVRYGGSSTSDYTKQITTASKIWNIQHNLNTEWWKLQINIIDDEGNVVYGDVDLSATTNNLLVLNFEKEVQGKIYIKK